MKNATIFVSEISERMVLSLFPFGAMRGVSVIEWWNQSTIHELGLKQMINAL